MSKSTKKSSIERTTGERTLVERKFWSVRVEVGEPKVLGKHLPLGVMHLQNAGPGGLHARTGYSDLDVVLAPGDAQITLVRDKVELAVLDFKPTTLEFIYEPLQK